ncbi:LysE family translocator [Psychromonas sp. Urea-02u-13]|uniref:LysE family translocator n=1 Tax=Psychromonas sp. Urea-02u-13 TaxID=2058326 RepID=UPI000C349D65|nr:LysE family translocator [Psychromonas sp. Urea-02u-13]PKG40222.1 lysine transporter LysE [Psychromonas sp. Urea-02u-13]
MEISLLLAISLFAFVMSVTPGPNNIMLLASGAQFGYQKTLPHIFGIILGIAALLASVLLGLGLMFERYPQLYDVLKVVGSLYLFWLAWKIASASTDDNALASKAQNSRPMTVIGAALFQFVNPKAWAMVIGSISSFTLAGDRYIESGLWIMLCFALMGFVAISLWAYLGVAIKRLLTTPKRRKSFNYTMGAMTVATLFFILN